MSDYKEARKRRLTMDVATAMLAEEIESACDGMLSLRLSIGAISSEDLKPICGGRTAYSLRLAEVDYHTDDWTYTAADELCQGVASFLREWQRRLDSMVQNLSSIPDFADAWKGGGR